MAEKPMRSRHSMRNGLERIFVLYVGLVICLSYIGYSRGRVQTSKVPSTYSGNQSFSRTWLQTPVRPATVKSRLLTCLDSSDS